MYAVYWLSQITLILDPLHTFMVRSWWDRVKWLYGVDVTAYIHGTELIRFGIWLVWFRKVTLSGFCVHCILDSRIHLADFMFLLYIAQCRQSARLFLKTSELGPPAPSTAGECAPPLLWFGGGGAHSHACEGLTLRSWCDRVKWPIQSQKNQHKVTLTSQSDFKSYLSGI
jgi:hypothetical protein